MRNLRHELYGESVFTSFRSFDGKVFGFQEHIDRLVCAARETYLLTELSRDKFLDYFIKKLDILDLFRKNPNHYFRLTIYATGDLSLSRVRFGLAELELDLAIRPIQVKNFQAISLKLTESPYGQNYIPIKNSSYYQSLHYRKKAILGGFDDVVFTMAGSLTEASTSNIIFRKGEDYFSPRGDHFLQGITLELFQRYCASIGVKFTLEDINTRDLSSYDACYLLNSIQLLTQVKKIDDLIFKLEDSDNLKENFINYNRGNL